MVCGSELKGFQVHRSKSLGFILWDLTFAVEGFTGSKVQGFGVKCVGFEVQALGLIISGLGFRV